VYANSAPRDPARGERAASARHYPVQLGNRILLAFLYVSLAELIRAVFFRKHSLCRPRIMLSSQALKERLLSTRHLGDGGPRSRNGDLAIVTLDFVEPDEKGNAPAMCFCVDCFSDEAEQKGGRVDRILSHVSPTSPVPRSLLGDLALKQMQDGCAPGEIPWCSEVKPAKVSASTTAIVPAAAAVELSAGKTTAWDKIDAEKDELDAIAFDLWQHPEIGYEEEYAHERVASFLEGRGFEVQRSCKMLVCVMFDGVCCLMSCI
jgi:hypothetical protein